MLIERDWYRLGHWGLDAQGRSLRHFSWVELSDGVLQEVSHRWYSPAGDLLYRQTLHRSLELQAC